MSRNGDREDPFDVTPGSDDEGLTESSPHHEDENHSRPEGRGMGWVNQRPYPERDWADRDAE